MHTRISLIFHSVLFMLTISTAYPNTDQTKAIHSRDSVGDLLYKKARNFDKQFQFDSAYFYYHKSLNQFQSYADSVKTSKIFLKLAVIDYKCNDFLSCENNCIESMNYTTNEVAIKNKLSIYNLLGLVSKSKLNFEEAIDYQEMYRKTYLTKKDTLRKFILYQNNLGNIYKETGQYGKSITAFNKILSMDSLKNKFPKIYARALDNKAWSLYLDNKTGDALPLLVESLDIRRLENDKPGLVMSNLHLGQFFLDKNANLEAEKYALHALQLCNEINNPRDKMEVLFLLSKIDESKSHLYFKQYKTLKDSIINKERLFKDQTAKIRYQTTQKEAQIKAQKILINKRNKSLLLGAFFFVIVLLIALLFWFQKQKIIRQNTTIKALQKELHHRVKNNLSFINTFIEIAMEEFPGTAFNNKLIELQNRIDSIYNVHVQLYQNEDVTRLDIKKYITEVVSNIQNSFGNQQITVLLNIEDNITSIPVNKSIPIGLIINEYLTNSYKYAFVDNQKGKIHITLRKVKNTFSLELSDNGKGLPESFNLDKTTSFGLRVMKLLAKQINGTFELDGSNGVQLRIHFPK